MSFLIWSSKVRYVNIPQRVQKAFTKTRVCNQQEKRRTDNLGRLIQTLIKDQIIMGTWDKNLRVHAQESTSATGRLKLMPLKIIKFCYQDIMLSRARVVENRQCSDVTFVINF